MVPDISNSSLLSTRKDISTLLTYSLILGNIKTNDLITLSKYSMKYLELVFLSTNFERTILSTLPSQIFFVFSHYKILILILLPHQILTLLYCQKILMQ